MLQDMEHGDGVTVPFFRPTNKRHFCGMIKNMGGNMGTEFLFRFRPTNERHFCGIIKND